MADNDFEPKIVAFLCNWCTYTGADLAGTSRIQYPPNVRIIRTASLSAAVILATVIISLGTIRRGGASSR